MSKHHDRNRPQQQHNRITTSNGPLVVPGDQMENQATDEQLNPTDPPVILATDVEEDQSVSGGSDVDVTAGDPALSVSGLERSESDAISVEIEDLKPEDTAPVIDIKAEEIRLRQAALRQIRIRPRKHLRLRVPHPNGKQSMWVNLVAGKETIVPAYVRDWLFEKGQL